MNGSCKHWSCLASYSKLVLLSLLLQVILILLGNRRKYINKIWIKIIVWPAYLLADLIATTALGIQTNRFSYHSGPLDAQLELTAFWAPFLLLHLVMVAGLIKYGERAWVLWSASYEQRSKASKSPHHNILQSISDVQDYSNISDDKLLQVSYGMFEMAKSLLAGVSTTAIEPSILAKHQEVTSNLLEKMSPKDAFKVIEIQLGFMYDLLYTKALVSYTTCGIVLRITSFLLTSIVLVLFSLAPHNVHKYSKVDLCITFSLLAVAIVLELYAALAFLFSDRTLVWMRKHNFPSISRYITSLPIHRNHRWSNYMGQFNLLSYFFNEKPMGFRGILELLKINEKLEKQRYATYPQVPEDLKEWLVMHSKKFWRVIKESQGIESMMALSWRGSVSLSYMLPKDTVYILSTGIELQQTIIVWHIATELCYHLDHDYFIQRETRPSGSADTGVLNWKMSKRISRYMMYLLAISPETLPASGATGQINFEGTCDEGRKEIASFESKLDDQVCTLGERKHKIKIEASKWLYERHKDSIAGENQIEQQLSGSLLSLGCVLANHLTNCLQTKPEEERMEKRWDAIGSCWFEFLYHAGRQSSGNQHAQQLRQGGEFLTHIWLLYEELTLLDKLSTAEADRNEGE
ncbi:hypothetical protein NC653_028724 [Populus alba x Populus x berolinensis]|uniref:DUF4220 domain-containing protein n=1 Tax=Populus alba x Populus x berolinensis TaxID=444605 RepID=A0AAD6M0H5_9ROSI|nr:hypothetical protein NC653_028724 [Populus alba x Populus x berolinensis]